MSESAVKNSLEMPIKYVKLGDVTEVIRGASPRPKGNPKYFGGNIPWIMIADVTRAKGKYIISTRDTVTEEGAKKSRYLKKGTLILSNSGTVCVPKILGFDGCIHDGFVAFPEINSDFDKEFLYHYFNYIRPRMINENRQGITQVNLNTTIVKNIDVPVFELEQQKRIVSKIEELFSHIDAGIEALKIAKQLLKQYRQSVLKAAVTGELTKEWREANKDKLEPASQLLERILKERREKWEEQQLEQFKTKGKMPKDDKWKDKHKGPIAADPSRKHEIPELWTWATFDQIGDRVTVGHVGSMKDEYIDEGVPFLRSQNVRENRYDSTGLKYVSPEFHQQLQKSSLQPGDLVTVRSGSVGVTCFIPEHLKEANCSDLVIVKQPKAVIPKLAAYYMNTITQTKVAAEKVGVALTHFNTKSMAEMPLPVPPLQEQEILVELVDQKLSDVEKLDAVIDEQLIKSERNKQAVLASAFSGKLN